MWGCYWWICDIMRKFVNQWDIYIVDLGNKGGSVQNGVRPCVIVQNAIGNACSPTSICLPITSKVKKSNMPPHYMLHKKDYPFFDCEENIVLCEQVCTIDVVSQVQKRLGTLKERDRENILEALMSNFRDLSKEE